MSTVTRFAPSPTGPLHIGGARTALFNYLYAKSKNGFFKIRVEDTDKNRNTLKSIDSIINGLDWLGIKTDYDIVFQSKNISDHIEFANSLIAKGLAYKCFHDENYIKKFKFKKFVSEWRDPKKKKPNKKKFCIRIKSPLLGSITINDKVQGKVTVKSSEIDDYIIIRSDGSPTFLLSSTIDDYRMKVTDIIRGDDHLTNSFRQKILYEFLNYNPSTSHIPLIHNQKNEKLSKRDNSLSIIDYKEKGFLPESIINYLLRMGWSYENKEYFTITEAIKLFTLEKIGKSPSKTDEKKLIFLNNHYIKKLDNLVLSQILKKLHIEKYNQGFFFDDVKILDLIEVYKSRANTLNEIVENINSLNVVPKNFNDEEKKILKVSKKYKKTIVKEFSDILNWNSDSIENKLSGIVKKLNIGFKEIAQPIRLTIIGKIDGPSISKIMGVLGKNEVINRINKWY